MRMRPIASCLALSLFLTGCIAQTGQTSLSVDPGPRPASKILTIALAGEPTKVFSSMGGGGTDPGSELKPAIHQKLASYDDRGEVHPQLATELPSQARGSWDVRPDGSMRTTYSLRRDVTWHDGTPLTARDFVFAWTIWVDPELPMAARTVANQIRSVTAPDDFTLVLDWRGLYPEANAIDEDDLGPLPVHLLGPTYEQDKEALATSQYFKREFLGVGPYRMEEWEPGSHITLARYNGFYGARPKIDTLKFHFVPNRSTVVAHLLSGFVDATSGAGEFSDIMEARRQWQNVGRTPLVVFEVGGWRMLSVQFRPDVVQPRELRDVRVRRALLQAIDRQAMSDTFFEGAAPVAWTFVPEADARWDWIKDVVTKYDYDARQARQLLSSIWQSNADGTFSNTAGERVSIPLWTTTSEREIAVIGDYWRDVGVPASLTVLGESLTRDIRLRASYPGLDYTRIPLDFTGMLRRTYSEQCPGEQNRWVGNNRGCYLNSENDRLIEALYVAIDPHERRRLTRDLIKGQTEDLPVLPLYFDVTANIYRAGVSGPRMSSAEAPWLWNVVDWDLS
jgi:peptide/nickel transport system substrate-binding protein